MRSLLTLLTVSLFACQTAPETKPSTPPVLLLSMERGACLGRCPVYRVEVMTDGRLRFKGERNVKVVEAVEVKLEKGTLEKVTARFEQSGFGGWKDYLRPTVTDQATVVLTYKGKIVRHSPGDLQAPPELTQLEGDVDALLGTARWISGTGTETK